MPVPSEVCTAIPLGLSSCPTICVASPAVLPISNLPTVSNLALSAEFVKNPIAPAELSLDFRANIFGVEE